MKGLSGAVGYWASATPGRSPHDAVPSPRLSYNIVVTAVCTTHEATHGWLIQEPVIELLPLSAGPQASTWRLSTGPLLQSRWRTDDSTSIFPHGFRSRP